MNSVDNEFVNIVHSSLWEVDVHGDNILKEEGYIEPKFHTDQLPPLIFPFGYLIISSTFAYFEEEEDDQS